MTSTLLAPWTGPFGGVPPFDAVRVEEIGPALDSAIAEHLAEIDAIARDPAPPTFDNTLVALERAGKAVDRVLAVYGVWSATMNDAAFQAVEREMSPKLAAYFDRIHQNAPLFSRIAAVYEARETSGLTPEQQRLAWLYHTTFVRAGARLDAPAKARLSEINQRLAALFTGFSQNVLRDESDQRLIIRDEAGLAGLPRGLREAAAVAAADAGIPGAWAIANTRSAMDPFLTYAEDRGLREQAWRLFVGRGASGGATDNAPLIAEILALRTERARLLGYETHAHWRVENAMSRTPARALELMTAVWPLAVARVREEVADMQRIADESGAGITIAPWDYRYFAEKVRKARFDLDQAAVKPYLQLDQLREAMFWVAGELFGMDFTPVDDVPVYHRDVRVWRVDDRRSGAHVGLWYFDPYARAGKRSGAWMSGYRNQERVDAPVTTIVSNNANFVPPTSGEPALVSWDDASTLFHEFGHALHGLCSDVTYPSLSGTAVARDFVEFPSQLLEEWLMDPQVLDRFARHYETGEVIPQALVERIRQAATFNQGFETSEYLASALYDMRIHLAAADVKDPAAFAEQLLAELRMPGEVDMRHRPPHFLHVYASDGYSAGYYSYLWADVLTADALDAFREGDGLFDPDVAARLRRHVFAAGNTTDPAEAYRNFRGRDARVEALMRKRGLTAVRS
ncbi:MAG TPA: M3 family metallopeptidase [Gemmatimonadaceae bacterium]|nr:M3 family metallopeptidase [Gemmatimonadaceae bacterium]